MVFTITTYYNPVRRHLYGVYHHNLLQGTSMVFTITTCWKAPQWCLPSQPVTSLLESTSMVFTITTYYKHVRRHLYGVYHHNLLQAC